MTKHLLFLFIWMYSISLTWATPAQVIIIRHGEKPPEPSGRYLSPKGLERAAALAPFFLTQPEVLQYDHPAAIYAKAADTETSFRPIETVKPLAAELKINLNDHFKVDEYGPLAKEILSKKEYEGKMVLICWEHHRIYLIAKALGVENPPSEWKSDVFDRLWIINFDKTNKPTLKILPQKLLYGDAAE